jgi:demethylmenaquinone methyltransferase/2-methoxy-6-polyprenyl-1,4-benzoquinol methylase
MPSVRGAPPEQHVRSMFDGLVERYDLLNGLLSLGQDRAWRRATARAAQVAPGERVLDLGCGTGDLGRLLIPWAKVVGADLSHRMLLAAKRKTNSVLHLVEASAFRLPFPAETFDAILSGFVLRNLEDLPKAFEEMARVVRRGRRIALVDITEPRHPLLRRLFGAYFGTVAPALGWAVGKRDAYRYLVQSLAQLPPAEDVCSMLARAGFRASVARPLSGGMVTLFTAHRGDGAGIGA